MSTTNGPASATNVGAGLLICGLSGTVPIEPVVSKLSGIVYEKRLIEKHIGACGTEPGGATPLSLSDLLPIHPTSAPNTGAATVRVRPPSHSSIPSLLSSLQSEWDAVMVESFSLKQQLDQVRQELATALYQHDAACRVVARLVKERDEARRALNAVQASAPAATTATAGATPSAPSSGMDVESSSSSSSSAAAADGDLSAGINTASVRNVLDETGKQLTKDRKKRMKEVLEIAASKEDISALKLVSATPLHSATEAGITCAASASSDASIIATGGVDGNVVIFNRVSGKIVDTLKGHSKRITDVAFQPKSTQAGQQLVLSASKDQTVQFWQQGDDGKYSNRGNFSVGSSCSGVSIHPSGQYGVVSSSDGAWTFFDVATARARQRVTDDKTSSSLVDIQFHPDGLLLGCANEEGLLKVWDVKAVKNVATFKGHLTSLTSLAFSENGYHLASADKAGQVKLWDLRKLSNFHSIDVGCEVSHVNFDESGSFLGVASRDGANVYHNKEWNLVSEWKDHSAPLTSIHLTLTKKKDNFAYTTSLDRSLRLYALP